MASYILLQLCTDDNLDGRQSLNDSPLHSHLMKNRLRMSGEGALAYENPEEPHSSLVTSNPVKYAMRGHWIASVLFGRQDAKFPRSLLVGNVG